ncbi:MAG: sulfatase-like hydrolase/transferase, partial [Actinomycetota bacterium]|nr:sulfatase-like hydrolase/transferase [Actinomycetota bacterium]
MNRTDLLRGNTTLLVTFALFALVLAMALSPDLTRAARPNIIVIQTDDQSARTVKAHFRGRQGKFRRVMPNTVRKIFNRGTEFRNYYATAPVCSPSRASLLSGQYPHNSKLTGNDGPNGGWRGMKQLPIFQQNLAVTLKRSGYRTAHFGKLINGYYDSERSRVDTTVPPGWDSWFTTAFLPGTRYYGYMVNDNGRAAGPFGDAGYASRGPGIDPKGCTKKTLTSPRRGVKCRYLTDVMTRGVVREIREKKRKPLYIQLDYQAPHGDMVRPKGPQPATRHLNS